MEFIKNSHYQILTPTGFKKFSGIRKTVAPMIITIILDNNTELVGTPDHYILDNRNIKRPLFSFRKGELLNNNKIINIAYISGKFIVYTIQGVEGEYFYTQNNIISSNCAYIPNNIFNEFYSSVYPTIASGQETKIIMVSSAKDLNHFYELWSSAQKKENTFAPFEVNWQSVPGRNETWVRNTISDIGESRFNREFKNEFFGSLDGVVPNDILKDLSFNLPLVENSEYKLFEEPKPNELYIGIVDLAEGHGEDYSVLTIIKLGKKQEENTEPHKVVFTLRTNKTSIFQFTELVWRFSLKYNEAWLLVEVNIHDIATSLYQDYEYENLIRTTLKKQKVASGFTPGNNKLGVKTTVPVKKLGLEMLINLLKSKKLILSDIEIIKELSTLTQKKKSYEAEVGCHDDLAMTLILFSWLLTNQEFQELVDVESPRAIMKEEYINAVWNSLPTIFIEDGITQNI